MRSINPTLFVVATLVNLLAIKLGGYLLPDRLYFSFSAFLFDERSTLKLESLVIKLALPFATAFLIAAAASRIRASQLALSGRAERLDRLVAEQLEVTLTYSAFLSALLMAWPYILMWDILIDPKIASQRLLFLLAYFAYFVGYAFFARAGVEAAAAVFSDEPRAPITVAGLAGHPAVKPVVTAVSAAVASGIAAFLVAGPR